MAEQKRKKKPSIQLNRDQVYSIREQINEKLSELLTVINIDFAEHSNRLTMACPVHGGTDKESCCIYTEGQTTKGNWICWSYNCHLEYGGDILGFIRGALKLNFPDSMEFCLKFLNKKLEDIAVVNRHTTAHEINKVTDILMRKANTVSLNIPRKRIISALQIPSPYFLNRGYSEQTLIDFDVGDCHTPNKEMTGRSVAPIYDEDFNYVGCVGRDISGNSKRKWKHNENFKKCYLYGMHLAKPHIQKAMSIVLVEGQGDVWRLYEAGIKNAVGIFGADITEDQIIILEGLLLLNVIILTDMDEPGRIAANTIKNKLKYKFNCFTPTIEAKDIGEMTVDEINEQIKPQIRGMF